jgi:hypothetical protein
MKMGELIELIKIELPQKKYVTYHELEESGLKRGLRIGQIRAAVGAMRKFGMIKEKDFLAKIWEYEIIDFNLERLHVPTLLELLNT